MATEYILCVDRLVCAFSILKLSLKNTLKKNVTVTTAEWFTIRWRIVYERFLIKVRSNLIGAIRLVASHP